jgi:hypothetical protein
MNSFGYKSILLFSGASTIETPNNRKRREKCTDTDRQAGRQTDRQTDRKIQTDRQKNTDRLTDRQKNTERQAGRQAE